jgi:hypothetical protein
MTTTLAKMTGLALLAASFAFSGSLAYADMEDTTSNQIRRSVDRPLRHSNRTRIEASRGAGEAALTSICCPGGRGPRGTFLYIAQWRARGASNSPKNLLQRTDLVLQNGLNPLTRLGAISSSFAANPWKSL